MGNNDTEVRTNKQQISDKVHPNKNHSTCFVECLRLRLTVQIPYHARSRLPNTTADFLLRLELTPKEIVQLNLREDILTYPIEVNLQSTDVTDEEQLFFQTKTNNRNRKFLPKKHLVNNLLLTITKKTYQQR